MTKVSNPIAASGGEDPPTEEQAREQAIQSLRVLGRLVSLADFEVEATHYGGVVKAKARWEWDETVKTRSADKTSNVWSQDA
ncbi:hypothetical protein DB30_03272 [Enhygromyxa salina]|uniref:Uncharacterized protein n=1 Tax=Enhygromyxa salina TaxID=215803 RepID=A0A0C2CUJ6_9BACT|nr:hypothetical protein DB30_03272 [Enhygromyxa salina]